MSRLKYHLVLICLFFTSLTYSQHSLKLNIFSGSGFSLFAGPGATGNSGFYRNGLSFPAAVDSIGIHFGNKPRENFVAGLQLEYALSPAWVLLLSTQYEKTGSRLNSDSVISPSGNYKTNGSYSMYNDFISINPQIGKVFNKGKLGFMLHGGIDYGFRLDRGDQFDFTDQSGKKYSIGHGGGRPEVNDFRLTAGAGITLNKWSIDLNYKHGLTDYNTAGTGTANSRILHFRLLYRLLKNN